MHSETAKILSRRFTDRFMESGLLIIAVALGIGAASSGIALLANTISSGRKTLESPTYREIVVSSVGEADDMTEPVSLRPVQENAVLTSADLDAAGLVPAVNYAYVQNYSRMSFINEESISREQAMRAQFAAQAPPEGDFGAPPAGDASESAPALEASGGDPGAAPEGAPGGSPGGEEPPGRPEQYSEEDLAAMAAESSILISELEEARGYKVTPEFFSASGVDVAAGSFFSQQDMTGSSSIAVLGHELALSFLEEGDEPDSLIGKQILTREGLVTIIGVLESGEQDEVFFEPYRSSGGGDFRRSVMNTQLRFSVSDPEKLDETALQLQEWFTRQFGEQQIVISNPRAEAQQLISRNTGLALLIMFLSLSGLFIASVNVSNILMSRSMRMKKHVGILMALGASRSRIAKLFALESLVITMAGALAGMIISLPLGNYMQSSLGIDGGTWAFTLLGVLLSALLTLSFGLLPARQFSRIDPALAMRAA